VNGENINDFNGSARTVSPHTYLFGRFYCGWRASFWPEVVAIRSLLARRKMLEPQIRAILLAMELAPEVTPNSPSSSPADHTQVVRARKSPHRSRVGNGSAWLTGVDQRSAWYRRFKDCIHEYLSKFPLLIVKSSFIGSQRSTRRSRRLCAERSALPLAEGPVVSYVLSRAATELRPSGGSRLTWIKVTHICDLQT
jgi:hypothetical protein